MTQKYIPMKKIFNLAIVLTAVFFLQSCGSSKTAVKKMDKPVKAVSSTDKQTKLYVQRFNDIAKKEMKEYGIPASITLAQGILESASGTSRLAREANNHFGIKCADDWEGDKVYHDDDSRNECFRKYKNPEDSFRDHSKFLAKRRRYSFLFRLPLTDYEAWAKGLKRAGYATDPSYPSKLIYLIEKYNLHQYDKEVLKEMKIKTKEVAHEEKKDEGEKIIYEVKPGETLFTISKKFGIPVKEIKEMNNLVDFDIYEGQILVLRVSESQAQTHNESVEDNQLQNEPADTVTENQPVQQTSQPDKTVQDTVNTISQAVTPETGNVKNVSEPAENTKAETEKAGSSFILHEVKAGETLYSLSKKYNVSLSQLMKINGLEEPILHVGQKLKIPVQKAPEQQEETTSKQETQTSGNLPAYHIVQPGETLYRIHVKYGIPIEKLKELNGLKDNTIHVGQKIKLHE